jgi:hypothetical protein
MAYIELVDRPQEDKKELKEDSKSSKVIEDPKIEVAKETKPKTKPKPAKKNESKKAEKKV